MDKNSYNDIDKSLKELGKSFQAKAPEKLKSKVLDVIEKLPEKKYKNYRFKGLKIAGLTAVILASSITLGAIFPAYAEAIPVIGATFKSINEKLGVGEVYIKGAKGVDLSKTYDGVTMTIKDVYYDGVEVAIAYELKSKNEFLKEKPAIFPIIKYNEEYIKYKNETSTGEFVDEKTYVGMASYSIRDEKLPEKVNIDFIVNDLYGNWVGVEPERFDFKLNLDASEMKRIIHSINKDIEYKGSKFTIKDIVFSELNTIIDYDAYSKGVTYEENGEQYTGFSHDIKLFAMDDKGMPIDIKNSHSRYTFDEDLYKGKGEVAFEKPDSEIKSITVIPVVREETINHENNRIEKHLDDKDEVIFKLKNGGSYILSPLKILNDKITLEVKIKDQYIDSKDRIGLYFSDKSKKDEESYIEPKVQLKGLDKDGYAFTVELPKIENYKDLVVETYDLDEVILEDQKITIDISEIK